MADSGATSNFSEVFARLRAGLARATDLTQANAGQDIADIATAGIHLRTLDGQKTPDGSDLPANRGQYGERKRAAGIPVGVGLRNGGQMLSPGQIQGGVDVTPDEMVLTQGADEFNKMKGNVFEKGTKDGRLIPRHWWGWDEDMAGRVREVMIRRVREEL